MNDRRKVIILFNRRSGASDSSDLVARLIAELKQVGLDPSATDSLDDFEQAVELFSQENTLHSVIAIGGDGTASAVTARIRPDTPLWLCPRGTENLLARYLGMSDDPKIVVNSLVAMKTRRMDAANANGKLFLIVAGIGYDAEVVRMVHENRSGHIQRWQYFWPIAKSVASYRFPRLSIRIDDGVPFEAAWCFCNNVPRYADQLRIAPMAIDDDGAIDVCTFARGGIMPGLKYLWKIRTDSHQSDADFNHQLGSSLTVDVASNQDAKVPYQLDGDFGGYLPLKIELLRNRVCFIQPAE